MQRTSKDPLTSATTKYLNPLLRDAGFKRYSNRSFAKISNNEVFQYLDLQMSAYGGKDFAVNFCTILMTRRQEFIGSTTFKRLPRGLSHEGWWSALSHDSAYQSMQEICEKVTTVAVPWFESTSSASGLAIELEKMKVHMHPNPHTFFELGCCYATTGDLGNANSALKRAVSLFQAAYDEMPARTWAVQERDLALSLIKAICEGIHQDLLAMWRQKTFEKLKLHKIS
jgi:hypothetical protein